MILPDSKTQGEKEKKKTISWDCWKLGKWYVGDKQMIPCTSAKRWRLRYQKVSLKMYSLCMGKPLCTNRNIPHKPSPWAAFYLIEGTEWSVTWVITTGWNWPICSCRQGLLGSSLSTPGEAELLQKTKHISYCRLQYEQQIQLSTIAANKLRNAYKLKASCTDQLQHSSGFLPFV